MQGGAIAKGRALRKLYAVGSAFCFALFTLALRWRKGGDMMPTILSPGIFATIICFAVTMVNGAGVAVPRHDIIIATLMGVFQTGVGLVPYTIGARRVAAVQLALLPLIEVILSPLWVAVFIGEFPTYIVLLGGFLVGFAIVSDALLTARSFTSDTFEDHR